MDRLVSRIFLLALFLDSVCSNGRFFISAPNVFHGGIRERVFVQIGGSLLNTVVTIYLEDEDTGKPMSEKIRAVFTAEGEVQAVELMIDKDKMSELLPFKSAHPYLLLVAESPSFTQRSVTRVLVSRHKGYIFIQTDQPVYNRMQEVKFRIFTLDHTMRPSEDPFRLSITNSAGNIIFKSFKSESGGISSGSFIIPDVSERGTWKIVAHYADDDEANAATLEFQVQRFTLPSFGVTIGMENNYFLLDSDELRFTISAVYSYGERVSGAYHCRFSVKQRLGDQQVENGVLITGLEHAGSIKDGKVTVILPTRELKRQLQRQTHNFTYLERTGARLGIVASVIDTQSGELQEGEVSIPIVSHRYKVDLSRTRSYFTPEAPLEVVVLLRLPDGSPADGVPVEIRLPRSVEKMYNVTSNRQGAASVTFHLRSAAAVTVEVKVDGREQAKEIRPASSPSGSYLYISVSDKLQRVGEALGVTYYIINGPQDRSVHLYYMVVSRGVLLKQDSLTGLKTAKNNLMITSDLVPSFRLIGYYYDQHGNIIADSVWIDVEDKCEKKFTVHATRNQYDPGTAAELLFNVDGQRAKVALLAVDKAVYALNTHNKLTAKQVFSAMQAYDLGCSYGGGSDADSTISDAGLAFLSQSRQSTLRKGFGCESHFSRQKRSFDLQSAMMKIKSNFSSSKLQKCCVRGFSLIPMKRRCEERVKRVSQFEKDPECLTAFLKCCHHAERLRNREGRDLGLGRTANLLEIEEFFLDDTAQMIRNRFPPSMAFTVFEVNDKGSYNLFLPDTITTWEIQAISLSSTHGFCVADPFELRAFQKVFVSLRLPYSVKKFEQLSIVAVIYNYGEDPAQLAVHMAQTPGLCSPGSAKSDAYVNVTVEPQSSHLVTFSAVPMVTGAIPVKIRLYDRIKGFGLDAIEKDLDVRTEGMEQRVEESHVYMLNERNGQTFIINGNLPGNTIPDGPSNIFVKMEGEGFSQSRAKTLLSPEGVAGLLQLPYGCAEQTMKQMAPTALARRYLDINQLWVKLPAGTRDMGLQSIEAGYQRILTFKKSDGSYGAWTTCPSSHWLTALVVKVLSLVAECQTRGEQAWKEDVVSPDEISHSVGFLLSVQQADGSFNDPNPVIERKIQGGVGGEEEDASMTAFITLALDRSLQCLSRSLQSTVTASILRSTEYLQSRLEELKRPYAVAITAYCLAICLSDKTDALPAWNKLQDLSTEESNGCRVWKAKAEMLYRDRAGHPSLEAITVETTAYALLTAVAHRDFGWADGAACWLNSQENYGGGFISTQDTIMALEALCEYELKRPLKWFRKVEAKFSVSGRRDIMVLQLENRNEKVETDIKKWIGNNVNVHLTGGGSVKLKVVKAFHSLEPKDSCELLALTVTVEGKVQYTAAVQDYEYYGEDADDSEDKKEEAPQTEIEWFDARIRRRRETDHSSESGNSVNYTVCVSHSLSRNLTGMAIADITLLSGFEVQTEDLQTLKEPPEQYISHYEVSYGRVILYFNKLLEHEECISFRAVQKVPIGLLQPAPASFYDYYEPNKKCTIFYAAPKRSKMVSTLCSGDVCQCAERPCHKLKKTYEQGQIKTISKLERVVHACLFPIVDYGYIIEVVNVSEKSNFELYTSKVVEVLKRTQDLSVTSDSFRVFVKRLQCKGHLEIGQRYLILGNDGTSTDSEREMLYLLESKTWIEQVPGERKCKASVSKAACKELRDFISDFRLYGCRQ